ncbi:GtrA family protein [Nocardioides zeae]|uniref:GtrA family protein n=1 Tax=Nocardioides imazamoxiresistens TaxID=3231893 RepID=A0ABU3PZ55_9ACTN|nr:GtrA family protein [Nocardioides zeae]MDT9594528.1 GtrA family protein [Nocardioides zeae]
MGGQGRRWRRLGAEVSRFSLVGVVATFVAVVLFNVLLHGAWLVEPLLRDRPLTAYVLANTVGMLVSYNGTRYWVFKHRTAPGDDNGFWAYVVINVATMALPVACLWFSRNVLGFTDPVSDNVAANVVGLALGFAARFYLFRQVVFNQPRRRVGATGPATRDRVEPGAP